MQGYCCCSLVANFGHNLDWISPPSYPMACRPGRHKVSLHSPPYLKASMGGSSGFWVQAWLVLIMSVRGKNIFSNWECTRLSKLTKFNFFFSILPLVSWQVEKVRCASNHNDKPVGWVQCQKSEIDFKFSLSIITNLKILCSWKICC